MRRLRSIFAAAGREHGSSAVEMAFASTVLVAMMFGICQISLAMYFEHFCSDAARQASRYASVRGSTSCANTPSLSNCGVSGTAVQTWVRTLNYPGIVSGSVKASTSWYAASTTEPAKGQTTTWSLCGSQCNEPGNLVKIVVTYPDTFQIPFGPQLSFTLSSTSEMLVSQ